jgi:peptidoglycan/LPS O-acetylase OafA/YrhL
MVLWNHFVLLHLPLGRGSWLGWLREGTGLSWAGVDLFFALSGFLIGGILIDRRDSPHLFRVFYLRRAARILPLYYVTLAFIAAAIAANAQGSFHLFPAWVYALFLTNFAIGHAQSWDWNPLSVMWSLAVEEQFYLTAPWVVRAISPTILPWMALILAALAEIARIVMLVVNPGVHLYMHVLMPLRMDALALGILAAWAVRRPSASPILRYVSLYWRRGLLAGAVLLAGLAARRPLQGSADLGLYGYLLISMEFSLLVFVVAKIRPKFLNRFLEARFLTSLGRHSYFIYLWHVLLGASVIRWISGPVFVLDSFGGVAVVALAAAVTWVAALASWKWFEGPIVELGHRHAY